MLKIERDTFFRQGRDDTAGPTTDRTFNKRDGGIISKE